jgi:hypothetical protein
MIQIPTPPSLPLDPNYVFNEVMPLVAVVTIVVAVALGLRWIFRSPVGEALAQRIRGGARDKAGLPDPDQLRVEMEERVAHLQEQVSELAERVDFTERLLTAERQRQLDPER